MKRYVWKLKNITCVACASAVEQYLRNQYARDVTVDVFAPHRVVRFVASSEQEECLRKGLADMGYPVDDTDGVAATALQTPRSLKQVVRHYTFWLSVLLTIPLLAHMVLPVPWLVDHWVQFWIATPVFMIGLYRFSPSALRSLRAGKPNMNVLIIVGASAAYIYSLLGLWLADHTLIYFETAAAVFSLVMVGDKLEAAASSRMQRLLKQLLVQEKATANLIAFDEKKQEIHLPVDAEDLKVGDLILVRLGERVPADAKILTGIGSADESIVSGESEPVPKCAGDLLIGGSVLVEGNVRAQVSAVAEQSVMGRIKQAVEDVQAQQLPIQNVADKISAVFVPLVLGASVATFIVNFFFFHQASTQSLLRAIAVLVVSCPCALGLAAPAAISVGLSRAFKRKVLFRRASNLEIFKSIRHIAFDKTGTLTTGQLHIEQFHCEGIDESAFKDIVVSLERYSIHPLSAMFLRQWAEGREKVLFKHVHETKGLGIEAEGENGEKYVLGSYKMVPEHLLSSEVKSLYLLRDGQLLGWVDVRDELRPESVAVVEYFHKKGMEVHLISGDSVEKCAAIAQKLNIRSVFAGQSPEQKQELVLALDARQPLAMVGDGVNDSPALAQATVGVSLGGGSQLAIQTADVVLLRSSLADLPFSLEVGKCTLRTIYENFFWAFSYNVVAIPCAAMGYLSPIVAACLMGISDVVLILNSLRLFYKKIA